MTHCDQEFLRDSVKIDFDMISLPFFIFSEK